jgi:hypothetical protein
VSEVFQVGGFGFHAADDENEKSGQGYLFSADTKTSHSSDERAGPITSEILPTPGSLRKRTANQESGMSSEGRRAT